MYYSRFFGRHETWYSKEPIVLHTSPLLHLSCPYCFIFPTHHLPRWLCYPCLWSSTLTEHCESIGYSLHALLWSGTKCHPREHGICLTEWWLRDKMIWAECVKESYLHQINPMWLMWSRRWEGARQVNSSSSFLLWTTLKCSFLWSPCGESTMC